MKKYLLLCALVVFSAPAKADQSVNSNTSAVENVEPTQFDWTGFYLGAHAGYGRGNSNVDYIQPLRDFYSMHELDGSASGIYFGYNRQMYGDVVLGIEADIAWRAANSDFKGLVGASTNYAAVGQDFTAAAQARLGMSLGRIMPYVSGGVSVTRLKLAYDMGVQDADFSKTVSGYILGAGVDWAAADNLIVKAEYRFSDFGPHMEYAFPSYKDDAARFDFRGGEVRLGVAYKF